MITIPDTILCSGNLVQDIVVAPSDSIVFGGTQFVERVEQHLGGNGANSSYTIGILGGRVRILGWVGADSFGSEIRRLLHSVGVDLTFLQTGRNGTATSVALVKTDGSRAFLHLPGVSSEAFVDFQGFDQRAIVGCSHYHLANPYALSAFRRKACLALRSAKEFGMTTSLDTAWDSQGEWMQVLAPCLPLVDLLFANEDEIRMLTGFQDPIQAVAAFRAKGARDVVVKLGERGCIVFICGQDPFLSPALPIQAIDTSGAGDCFVGAFLAALQRGLDCTRAAQIANAVGGLSASAFGGVSGLKSFEEICELLP